MQKKQNNFGVNNGNKKYIRERPNGCITWKKNYKNLKIMRLIHVVIIQSYTGKYQIGKRQATRAYGDSGLRIHIHS